MTGSQDGYIFKMAGAPISWKSKKQTVVARSTTEAEYLVCSEATREAQGLIYLHRDVTGNRGPTYPLRLERRTEHHTLYDNERQGQAYRCAFPQLSTS